MECICPVVVICTMAIASKARIQRMGVQKRQRIIKPAACQARVTCSIQKSLLQYIIANFAAHCQRVSSIKPMWHFDELIFGVQA